MYSTSGIIILPYNVKVQSQIVAMSLLSQVEQSQLAGRVAHDYQQHANRDHRAALQRKLLIEARKKFIESRSKDKVEPNS